MEPSDYPPSDSPSLLRRLAAVLARHRALRMSILGAALAVAVAILIGKAADYARLIDLLGEARAAWFPILLASVVVATLGYIVVYRGTARVLGGPVLPFWLTARVVAASLGATVVATPIGGLGVDYWALRRVGVRHHPAIARVLAFNTLEWTVLGGAAALAGLAELLRPDRVAPLAVILAWLAAVPACLAAAFWVTAPRRVGRLARTEGVGRLRAAFGDAISSVVIVRHILTHPVRHGDAIGGAALYWGGLLLGLWGGLRAFDVRVGLAALVLAYATGYAAMILPLPVGGAGGVDAALTSALTLVGVPLAPALLGVFAFRFFNFWLPLVPALIITPSLRRVREELPLVPYPGSEAGARVAG